MQSIDKIKNYEYSGNYISCSSEVPAEISPIEITPKSIEIPFVESDWQNKYEDALTSYYSAPESNISVCHLPD
jgi:hypothetical protein